MNPVRPQASYHTQFDSCALNTTTSARLDSTACLSPQETAATREVNLDGIVFGIIDISDPSFGGLESGKYVQQQRMEDGIAVGQQHVELGMKEEWGYGAGGGEAGGALGRAMKALPQKMADLEELARECFDDEVLGTASRRVILFLLSFPFPFVFVREVRWRACC